MTSSCSRVRCENAWEHVECRGARKHWIEQYGMLHCGQLYRATLSWHTMHLCVVFGKGDSLLFACPCRASSLDPTSPLLTSSTSGRWWAACLLWACFRAARKLGRFPMSNKSSIKSAYVSRQILGVRVMREVIDSHCLHDMYVTSPHFSNSQTKGVLRSEESCYQYGCENIFRLDMKTKRIKYMRWNLDGLNKYTTWSIRFVEEYLFIYVTVWSKLLGNECVGVYWCMWWISACTKNDCRFKAWDAL